jgi:purine-binding chemotaxis protein CheW
VYGIRLDQVIETMRPLPIEPLAGVPPFVLGLSVLRGTPVPVIDLANLFGAASPVRCARFVAVRAGHRHAVLAVESVAGVTALPERTLESLPPLVRDMSAQALDTIGRLDEGMLFVLKSGHIVPDAVWESVESRGTSPNAREATA